MSSTLVVILIIVIFILSKFIDSIIIFRLFVRHEKHISNNLNNSIYLLQEFFLSKEESEKFKEYISEKPSVCFSQWYNDKYGKDFNI